MQFIKASTAWISVIQTLSWWITRTMPTHAINMTTNTATNIGEMKYTKTKQLLLKISKHLNSAVRRYHHLCREFRRGSKKIHNHQIDQNKQAQTRTHLLLNHRRSPCRSLKGYPPATPVHDHTRKHKENHRHTQKKGRVSLEITRLRAITFGLDEAPEPVRGHCKEQDNTKKAKSLTIAQSWQ